MLGQKERVWTAEKNAKLMQRMDHDTNGQVEEDEFVGHFMEELRLESDERFVEVMEEFMECACVSTTKARSDTNGRRQGSGSSLEERYDLGSMTPPRQEEVDNYILTLLHKKERIEASLRNELTSLKAQLALPMENQALEAVLQERDALEAELGTLVEQLGDVTHEKDLLKEQLDEYAKELAEQLEMGRKERQILFEEQQAST